MFNINIILTQSMANKTLLSEVGVGSILVVMNDLKSFSGETISTKLYINSLLIIKGNIFITLYTTKSKSTYLRKAKPNPY